MGKRNFGGAHTNRPGRRRRSRSVRLVELNGFEGLDRRILPTVTATFADLAGELRILGDAGDNTIVVSRDAIGTILINNGAIAIQGGVPTVANTHEIFMNGQAGNDNLSLDETNGPLPGVALFGGDGNDTLIGGSGEDFADGGAGNDTILLGAGDDTFQWNPGDGSDTIDGQGGADTMQFNGSTAAEHIDVSASGRHVLFNRDLGGVAMDLVGVETINFSAMGDGDTINVDDQTSTDLLAVNLDLERVSGTNDGLPDSVVVNGTEGVDTVQVQPSDGTGVTVTGLFPVVNIIGAEATSDNLMVNGLGGDDLVDASALPANLIGLVLNGGAGSDLLIGSQGPDLVIGGPGGDSADLGDGGDTFVWNPGDGSDDVLGQGGSDRLVFNGSDNAENFGISANGNQARLTRDLGGVTMDLGGIETVDINALGGADTVTVNDLSGTDVTAVDVNLAGSAGSGDGQIDSVVVNGSEGADTVQILSTLDGSRITAAGLHAVVKVTGAEATSDNLTVNTLGGDDLVDASVLPADLIGLALNGGAGTDTIFGSMGSDLVNGGPGNDTVDLGAGDDTFVWNPGDGSDMVDGQGGSDRLVFNGSDVAENFVISANGNQARLTRDVGDVAMSLLGIETVDVNALGGADTVSVNDLSGTDVTAVDANLAGSAGGGDGQIDSVVVNGTEGDDTFQILSLLDGSRIFSEGLHALVRITGVEATSDNLTVNALGGDDTVNAALLPAGLIGLVLNGGAGTDTIFGSMGSDLVNGGPGNDTADLGAGDDTFVWNPGDGSDMVDGQDGSDRLVFNGSDVAENFVISANGNQARLTRDLGGVAMDMGGIETIDINALGGADTITVNDLSGTDVTAFDANLAGSAGGGDSQADSVVVNGTEGADHLQVLPSPTGTRITAIVNFLPLVRITGAEGANDTLTVNALGGDDMVDASLLPADLIGLVLNGGAGTDTIFGSQGNDLVSGGPGNDSVSLEAGDDTFVWNPGDGSDMVDGQDGSDRMVFNGSDNSEQIEISANGQRVRFVRDVGNISMDLGGVERVAFNALGGADTITVDDLSGTDVNEIDLDLAGVAGGNIGDAQLDSIVINDSNGSDFLPVLGTAGGLLVNGDFLTRSGLPYFVAIKNVEPTDALRINGNGGDDDIDASDLQTPVTFIADGGAGNDTVVGSPGNDVLLGGDGDDFVDGKGGNDIASLGAGRDVFQWDPGDGSDSVFGEDGTDTLVFDGSDTSENVAISANVDRVRFTRDVGGIAMDLHGIETIDFNARGGADAVTVNDLTGTELSAVNVNLAGSAGGGDGQADSVTVNGTEGNDNIQVVPNDSGTGITVAGLHALVNITGAEGANDHLTVNALGGDDVLDASLLASNLIGLALNGGDGNNTIVRDTSTFAIVSSLPTSTFGQAVSFTATVNPPNGGPSPTGTVQFVVDGVNFGGPVPLLGGSATSTHLGNLGAGSHTILAHYSGDGNYAANTDHLTQTINKAHLTVTADPKADRFGDAVPALTATISGFVNGDGPNVVGGLPGLTTAATSASGAGTYAITVGEGTLAAANYDFPNLVNGTLIVNKATPTITWANPADITDGTPLGSAQLDAVASIPGTFAYSPAEGTILSAGQHRTLTATFTPNDTTDFNSVTTTVSINVLNVVVDPPGPAPHATGIVGASHTRKGLVSITAAFDEALNPKFLNSLSLFSVLGGVRKHGRTLFSKSVLVNGFHYDDTAHTVTITLAKPFKGLVKATIRPGVVAANGASSSVGFTAFIK